MAFRVAYGITLDSSVCFAELPDFLMQYFPVLLITCTRTACLPVDDLESVEWKRE